MKPILVPVPRNRINKVWALVRKDIDRAIDISGDRFEPGELQSDLKKGGRQLWIIWRENEVLGVVVTKIFKGVGVCQIELCAGREFREWLDLIGIIEAWAKSENCSEMEIVGRAGWQRMLRNYKPRAVILRKRL